MATFRRKSSNWVAGGEVGRASDCPHYLELNNRGTKRQSRHRPPVLEVMLDMMSLTGWLKINAVMSRHIFTVEKIGEQ